MNFWQPTFLSTLQEKQTLYNKNPEGETFPEKIISLQNKLLLQDDTKFLRKHVLN